MNNIAVLLTVYNRREKTIKCLKALIGCSLPENYTIDIHLVNDGCTDGTGEVVKQQFPQVNIIQGTGSLFWNRGMHLAWTTAAKIKDYDFYVWLNDDTILYPNSILTLIETSESENNRSIICGSTCETDNPNKITYGGRNSKGTLLQPNGQKQLCVEINGNIVWIPKYVYSVVGINDPTFYHSMGDFDYGLRARKLGINSIVTPSVIGVCDDRSVFAAWCNTKTPIIKRLRLLYSPLGNNPIQFFKFENRHYGFSKACIHFFSLHIRAVFPVLWQNSTTGK